MYEVNMSGMFVLPWRRGAMIEKRGWVLFSELCLVRVLPCCRNLVMFWICEKGG